MLKSMGNPEYLITDKMPPGRSDTIHYTEKKKMIINIVFLLAFIISYGALRSCVLTYCLKHYKNKEFHLHFDSN